MDIRYLIMVSLIACGSLGHAEEQWYAGTGIGQYDVDVGGADLDAGDTAFRFFGGWKMNDTWSFEAGYTAFSEVSESTTVPLVGDFESSVDVSSLDFYARPAFPLNDQWELFGIVGLSRIEADVEVTVPLVGTVSDSSSDTELMYGFGGQFKLDDRWAVRGEWVNYDVDGDLSMLSVVATYSFR